MQYAVSVPPFAEIFQPRVLADLAVDAEQAGWDGFFLWDHVSIWPTPIADPWIALAAIGLATQRIKLGAMVTPLPRRRPVKFAREVVTLDHLCNGRLIVGVGSGAGPWEYEYLGDEPAPATRAAMLDEALELIAQLWTGEPTLHEGRFYRFRGDAGPGNPEVRSTPLLPKPFQSPRPPIWVAGTWPKRRPFRRAARWDGVLPMVTGGGFGEYITADQTRAIAELIAAQRSSEAPFDVVISGHTTAQDAMAERVRVAAIAAAGATWWLEDVSPWPFGWNWQGAWPVDAMRGRIKAGPPR